MQMRKALKKLGVALAAIFTAGALSGCPKPENVEGQVHDSGYSLAFPLRQGGDQIDFLVRVNDLERAYQFNLIFVERDEWPDDKKEYLRQMYRGQGMDGSESPPSPVRLRIRIDSAGRHKGRPVHIDKLFSGRSPFYGQRMNDNEIWRAQNIHAAKFEPGIYRVRVDNLAPAPQLDFETRFLFERDDRVY